MQFYSIFKQLPYAVLTTSTLCLALKKCTCIALILHSYAICYAKGHLILHSFVLQGIAWNGRITVALQCYLNLQNLLYCWLNFTILFISLNIYVRTSTVHIHKYICMRWAKEQSLTLCLRTHPNAHTFYSRVAIHILHKFSTFRP